VRGRQVVGGVAVGIVAAARRRHVTNARGETEGAQEVDREGVVQRKARFIRRAERVMFYARKNDR